MSAIACDVSGIAALRSGPSTVSAPAVAGKPDSVRAAAPFFRDDAAPRRPVSLNQALAYECDGWMRWSAGRG